MPSLCKVRPSAMASGETILSRRKSFTWSDVIARISGKRPSDNLRAISITKARLFARSKETGTSRRLRSVTFRTNSMIRRSVPISGPHRDGKFAPPARRKPWYSHRRRDSRDRLQSPRFAPGVLRPPLSSPWRRSGRPNCELRRIFVRPTHSNCRQDCPPLPHLLGHGRPSPESAHSPAPHGFGRRCQVAANETQDPDGVPRPGSPSHAAPTHVPHAYRQSPNRRTQLRADLSSPIRPPWCLPRLQSCVALECFDRKGNLESAAGIDFVPGFDGRAEFQRPERDPAECRLSAGLLLHGMRLNFC